MSALKHIKLPAKIDDEFTRHFLFGNLCNKGKQTYAKPADLYRFLTDCCLEIFPELLENNDNDPTDDKTAD